MLKKITAVKARQNLGQLMNEVSIKKDDYIIERAGKPLVAIIPIQKYRQFQGSYLPKSQVDKKLLHLQQKSLSKIWDNPEEDIYEL